MQLVYTTYYRVVNVFLDKKLWYILIGINIHPNGPTKSNMLMEARGISLNVLTSTLNINMMAKETIVQYISKY
jgi:hypothetical protein